MSIKSVNPATGEVVKEYPEPAIREVRDRIEAAHEAYLSWRRTSFSDRSFGVPGWMPLAVHFSAAFTMSE